MKTVLFIILFVPICLLAQKPEQMSLAELDSVLAMYNGRGDYEKAIPYAEWSLKKAEKEFGSMDSTYSEYLKILGFFYFQSGQYQKAAPIFQKNVALNNRIFGKNHPSYLVSINELGAVYQKLGNYEQAAALFTEAIRTEKELPHLKDYDYSVSINNLAFLYSEKGEFEKAEKSFETALKIAEEQVKDKTEALMNRSNILTNLALTYFKIGKYEQAEQLYLEIINLNARLFGKKHPDYAIALNNLAALYYHLQKYEQAENLYLEASAIDEKTLGKENPSFAVNLNNMAELYRKTGKFDKARKLYTESAEIWAKTYGKEHEKYALSLNNLALLNLETNQLNEAENQYKQALQIWEKRSGKEHPDYANSLFNLAQVYEKSEQFLLAEKNYLQSVLIREKVLGSAHPDYIKSLNRVAELYGKMGEFDKAYAMLLKAILSNCKVPDLQSSELNKSLKLLENKEFYSYLLLVNSLENIHQLSELQYNASKNKELLGKGYEALQMAMKFNEKIRQGFNSEEDKLRVLEQMSRLTYKAIHTGQQLNQDLNTDFLQTAFNYAEQNKSVLLADAVKGQRARTLSDLPDSIALVEIALQQELKRFQKMEIESRNPENKALARTRLNELQLQIDAFLDLLKKNYPRYHALKYKQLQLNSADIQQFLDKKSILLEYFVADSSTYIFSISKDKIELFQCPLSKQELGKRIKSLRKALSNYDFITKEADNAFALYTENAYWFYSQLIAPVLKDSSIQNLIIIADGELGHLPFEAFLTENTTDSFSLDYSQLPYLIKDYNIQYHYSANLWQETLKSPQQKNNQEMLVCAAAYPSMDSSLKYLRPSHLLMLRSSLSPLPAVEEEIKSLSVNFRGQFLYGESANERIFKEQASKYSVLHLAMHGLLNQDFPMLSSLAFSEDMDRLEDNFLQAYEIAQLHLNSDLVVLSACETGFGKFRQGEGIMSLARSFMYAGVPSLVVSLWQVNDHSTSVIMKYFYANLTKGMTKAAALRQAKLDYIKTVGDGGAAHPAFWAAFIQLGDSRPLTIKLKATGSSYWIYLISGLGVVVIGFGLLFWFRRKRR